MPGFIYAQAQRQGSQQAICLVPDPNMRPRAPLYFQIDSMLQSAHPTWGGLMAPAAKPWNDVKTKFQVMAVPQVPTVDVVIGTIKMPDINEQNFMDDWEKGHGIRPLAMTRTSVNDTTGELMAIRTFFNTKAHLEIPLLVKQTSPTDPGYDVQDVMTHEFAHWAGFMDLTPGNQCKVNTIMKPQPARQSIGQIFDVDRQALQNRY
jgi:hypothetical protein